MGKRWERANSRWVYWTDKVVIYKQRKQSKPRNSGRLVEDTLYRCGKGCSKWHIQNTDIGICRTAKYNLKRKMRLWIICATPMLSSVRQC